MLDEQTPVGQPIHLILDPVSSHWSAEVVSWLDAHPQRTFVFHFLPVHASWLSFYRVWFFDIESQMPPPSGLRGCEHRHPGDRGLHAHLNTHIAHPFEWTKGVRFYKRLKDKIAARSELQLAA